jgi:hypothetical protein
MTPINGVIDLLYSLKKIRAFLILYLMIFSAPPIKGGADLV